MTEESGEPVHNKVPIEASLAKVARPLVMLEVEVEVESTSSAEARE